MNILNKGKLPLSGAGIGALLSMLTGFFSGVSPGSIIIRGLFTAVLAAGFFILAEWLIKTFLPELGALRDESPSGGRPLGSEGNRVNIVMPDEMPGNLGNPEGMMGANDSEQRDGVSSEEGLRSLDQGAPENEIAENTESVHNNKPEISDSAAAADSALDSLPSMDSLEISVGSTGDDAGETEPLDQDVSSSPSSGKEDVDLGGNEDPEMIAKAVKTVLARDQQK